MTVSLFQYSPTPYVLSSRVRSQWRINFEALDDASIAALAWMIQYRVHTFGQVEGVPTGGLRLAAALQPYFNHTSNTLLIVDDVLTTGNSMEEWRRDRPAIGFVAFDRSYGGRPDWIRALWTLAE